jgi:hypothetical protein
MRSLVIIGVFHNIQTKDDAFSKEAESIFKDCLNVRKGLYNI